MFALFKSRQGNAAYGFAGATRLLHNTHVPHYVAAVAAELTSRCIMKLPPVLNLKLQMSVVSLWVERLASLPL